MKSQKHINSNSSSLNQLKRISGQISGIIKMVEEERSCFDTVDQVIAARNSLSRVGKDLLLKEVKFCSQGKKLKNFESILIKLFKY